MRIAHETWKDYLGKEQSKLRVDLTLDKNSDPSHKVAPTLGGRLVLRVYSGKPGCMCGCRGKYSDDPRVIRRLHANAVKLVEERLGEVDITTKYLYVADDAKTRCYCFYWED